MVICCFLGVLFHRAAAEGAVGYPALLSGWLLSEVSASDQFTQFAYTQVLQEDEAVFPPVPFEGKIRSWANEGEMAQPPTQWMWVPVVLQSKLIAALREKRREAAQGLAQCAGAIPKAAGGTAFPWVAAPLKHRQIQQVVFKPVQPHSSRSSCQLVPGGNTSRCPQETSRVSQEEGVWMIVEGLLLANIFLYWFDLIDLIAPFLCLLSPEYKWQSLKLGCVQCILCNDQWSGCVCYAVIKMSVSIFTGVPMCCFAWVS